MIAIPAVDLREGACVQLVGGEYTNERIRLTDPVAVARDWARYGFRRLHVVDLDAATGRGSNGDIVAELMRDTAAELQVGGGVRSTEQVDDLLGSGARAVVVGTRALEDADWLARLATTYPNEIIVAADVRDRRVVTRGWTRTLPRDIVDDEWLILVLLAAVPMRRIDHQRRRDLARLGGTCSRIHTRRIEVRRLAAAKDHMAIRIAGRGRNGAAPLLGDGQEMMGL